MENLTACFDRYFPGSDQFQVLQLSLLVNSEAFLCFEQFNIVEDRPS